MATVLVTGGTGSIGKVLCKNLQKRGYSVIIFTRSPKEQQNSSGIRFAFWDPEKGELDEAAFAEADSIVHLAGASIAEKRWTEKRKRLIEESRVKGCQLLVRALKTIPNKVQTVVSASAVGYYGNREPGSSPFIESDSADAGFLGQTCKAWEESIKPVAELGRRLVILRTGIVFDAEAGAYKEFLKPVLFWVAPALGNGNQAVSWIHVEDMARIYEAALEDERFSGVYNASSPQVATNKEIMEAIAEERHGKGYLSVNVPAFFLKLALGEMANEALLGSTAVSVAKLEATGFTFLYPALKSAVAQLAKETA